MPKHTHARTASGSLSGVDWLRGEDGASWGGQTLFIRCLSSALCVRSHAVTGPYFRTRVCSEDTGLVVRQQKYNDVVRAESSANTIGSPGCGSSGEQAYQWTVGEKESSK